MKNQNNEHDVGYKYLLSAKHIFVQLLTSFVQKEWVNEIAESQLELMDKSYVLQDFNEKEADLVYRMKTEDQEIIFYILMELQSKVDYQMPYRLLLYMNEIWRDVVKNMGRKKVGRKSFRLPVIIPIVLYNGKRKWTVPTQFKDMLLHVEKFEKEQVLNFEYILLDINRYDEQELLHLSNLMGSIFFLDQGASDTEALIKRLKRLVDILEKLTPAEFTLFQSWLKGIAIKRLPEEHHKQVEKIIIQTKRKEVGTMMTGFERNLEKALKKEQREAREKGHKEGHKEGHREGHKEGKKNSALETAEKMLKDGMHVAQIAKYTELSEEEIEEHQRQMKD
ncbi:Rpn family recombination-promoting nuclease/putative transposase [Lentibacillus salicampi]|uniref:Rpn family recombination-promoting nuclease/putative transposase n=1 Tax=Lentibacillus salicampi TaxID=175306 RepID=UPI0014301A39|nr:Rpn family recombination-promoting nuclease/putative transposase [Lentibacillus salicampi]